MAKKQQRSESATLVTQKAILAITAIIMVAGIILLHPAFKALFILPYTLIIFGDLAVLLGSKSETLKRFMLVFSVVGALSAGFFILRDLM